MRSTYSCLTPTVQHFAGAEARDIVMVFLCRNGMGWTFLFRATQLQRDEQNVVVYRRSLSDINSGVLLIFSFRVRLQLLRN